MELGLNHLTRIVSGFGGEHSSGLELDIVPQVDLYPTTANLAAK
jgi:hypothetical protein